MRLNVGCIFLNGRAHEPEQGRRRASQKTSGLAPPVSRALQFVAPPPRQVLPAAHHRAGHRGGGRHRRAVRARLGLGLLPAGDAARARLRGVRRGARAHPAAPRLAPRAAPAARWGHQRAHLHRLRASFCRRAAALLGRAGRRARRRARRSRRKPRRVCPSRCCCCCAAAAAATSASCRGRRARVRRDAGACRRASLTHTRAACMHCTPRARARAPRTAHAHRAPRTPTPTPTPNAHAHTTRTPTSTRARTRAHDAHRAHHAHARQVHHGSLRSGEQLYVQGEARLRANPLG